VASVRVVLALFARQDPRLDLAEASVEPQEFL
jgi:hypothetical protein